MRPILRTHVLNSQPDWHMKSIASNEDDDVVGGRGVRCSAKEGTTNNGCETENICLWVCRETLHT